MLLFRSIPGVKQMEWMKLGLFEIEGAVGPIEALAREFKYFDRIARGVQVGAGLNTIVLFFDDIIFADELNVLVLDGLLVVRIEE